MRTTTCHNCHATTANPRFLGWVETSLASRGGRPAYLCPDCARLLLGYYEKNDSLRGVSCGDAGFIPTHDCTTDVEFKSPIFRSLKWQKRLDTWETLRDSGAFRLTDDDGTHVHVGHESYINADTMRLIRGSVRPLFDRLAYAIETDSNAAIVWGRDCNGYCDLSVSRCDRYRFINVTNDNTIEFRLCKFASAAQYKALLKLCKGIAERVVKWVESGAAHDTAEKTGVAIARYYVRESARIAAKLR